MREAQRSNTARKIETRDDRALHITVAEPRASCYDATTFSSRVRRGHVTHCCARRRTAPDRAKRWVLRSSHRMLEEMT
jgi:hypothetical protein